MQEMTFSPAFFEKYNMHRNNEYKFRYKIETLYFCGKMLKYVVKCGRNANFGNGFYDMLLVEKAVDYVNNYFHLVYFDTRSLPRF